MRGEKVRTTQLLFSILLCLFWVGSEFSSVKTRCVYICSFGMSVCALVWSGEKFGRQCQMIIWGDTDHRVSMKGGVWMGGRERWRWGGWCDSFFCTFSFPIFTFLTFILCDVVVFSSSLPASFLITVAKWQPFQNSQRGIFIRRSRVRELLAGDFLWRLLSLTSWLTVWIRGEREKELCKKACLLAAFFSSFSRTISICTFTTHRKKTERSSCQRERERVYMLTWHCLL